MFECDQVDGQNLLDSSLPMGNSEVMEIQEVEEEDVWMDDGMMCTTVDDITNLKQVLNIIILCKYTTVFEIVKRKKN